MSVLGIFCRPNHPSGYAAWPIGMSHEDSTTLAHEASAGVVGQLGAHGYVTWIVDCADWIELNAVRDLLKQGSQWQGREDRWYAGPLDLVAAWSGSMFDRVDHNGAHSSSRWTSIGDNRAVAVVSGKEVLAMMPTRAGGFYCHGASDGECHWMLCPQVREGEPANSGRHCPLDT